MLAFFHESKPHQPNINIWRKVTTPICCFFTEIKNISKRKFMLLNILYLLANRTNLQNNNENKTYTHCLT